MPEEGDSENAYIDLIWMICIEIHFLVARTFQTDVHALLYIGNTRNALVSSPDPDSQQLRVDYITATWKVGLGNKNDALVPRVPRCLCPKIVRQSKFRTNLAQLDINKRYHFRMILLRVLCTII